VTITEAERADEELVLLGLGYREAVCATNEASNTLYTIHGRVQAAGDLLDYGRNLAELMDLLDRGP
jgi:hypothetical protein